MLLMDSHSEQVKNRLSIVDVVGSYITLIPSGRYFKARCPFHHEKTPSFIVTPDRGTFHCFGCQKGGDVFTFVQEIEGVDFKEALVRLAEKAGIDVSKSPEYSKEKSSKQVLREILELATKFYEVSVRKTPEIVEYLLARGLTKETLKTWRIGYAPDSFRSFLDFASKKYSVDDLVRSGLVVKTEKGVYDRFRDRIMFPISDTQGFIVAFSGRMSPSLEKKETGGGKYINSPETPIYHKSAILYGYHQAKQSLRTEQSCVLVEGQMDLLMLHQAGFKNTVALSGTACTDTQLGLIERFTDTLVIALDADMAGLQASWKTAEAAYKKGFHVYGIMIPDGKDPADYLGKEGAEGWKEVLSRRKDFILYRAEELRKKSRDSHGETRDISKEIIPLLAVVPNFILKERLMKEVGTIIGITEESLSRELARYETTHARDVSFTSEVKQEKIKEAPVNELITSYVGLVEAFWSEKFDEKINELKQLLSDDMAPLVDQIVTQKNILAIEAEVVYSTWTTENVHHAAEEILLRIRISHITHQIHDAKKQLENPDSDPSLLGRYGVLVKELDDLKREVREFDSTH